MHIFVNGKRVSKIEKKGRNNQFHFEDNSYILSRDISIIEYECKDCKKLFRIKKLHSYNRNREVFCHHCKILGDRNYSYGKSRTQETKNKISKKNKGRLAGEKNPFYGKRHTEETRKIISEKGKGKFSGNKNPFYGKKHPKELLEKIILKRKITTSNRTAEQKSLIGKKISESHSKLKKTHPEYYRAIKSKAAKASVSKQSRYKKNKIETIVELELKKRNLNFEYSIILGFKQYDFGSKEYRVLLEVHGDYWHCNPNVYIEPKNTYQINKIQKDIEKADFAKKHDMRLFYIWEQDINNNNFKVLDEIKDYINEIQTSRDSKN